MMIRITFLFIYLTLSSYSITSSDIETGYEKIGESVDNFKDEVENLKKEYKKVAEIVALAKKRQLESEAMSATTSDTMIKVGNQTSAFVKAEILRGESALLRNKEILYELWRTSQSISKEEIEEQLKDINEKLSK